MAYAYLELADFLLIAVEVLGVPAQTIARSRRIIALAYSALAAPAASFAGEEFYPQLAEKAAVLCAHLIRNHPLPDGNKRTAHLCLIEFIERNGYEWLQPADDTGEDETVETMVRLAAGQISTVDNLLALPSEATVNDIARMSWLFGKRHARLFRAKVKVNPSYRSGVGGFGATPDLLINRYVIDVKAAVHPVLKSDWLYQVLGYVLLDVSNDFDIQGVGFYLARQGIFVQWPLGELMTRLSGGRTAPLSVLRREFQEMSLRDLKYG